MINYTLSLWNLGLCPKCLEANVFLDRQDGAGVCQCTNKDCLHIWPDESAFMQEQGLYIRAKLMNKTRSLNKQRTFARFAPGGKVLEIKGGIEWTAKILPGGHIRSGFTTNPLAGCNHECKWEMPDGSIAICYAKSVAERVANAAYPHGFEHEYWYPERLYDGLKIAASHRIFPDSMSDMFGAWVDKGKIFCMLRAFEEMSQHDFLVLTKNPVRMPKFLGYIPNNVWAGFSSPPDWFMGKRLSRDQQARYFRAGLKALAKLDTPVKWVSFEPLSWDLSSLLAEFPGVINWAVIGAASNGPAYYQPNKADVDRLENELDRQGVKVFYKGNLDRKPGRYEFPD